MQTEPSDELVAEATVLWRQWAYEYGGASIEGSEGEQKVVLSIARTLAELRAKPEPSGDVVECPACHTIGCSCVVVKLGVGECTATWGDYGDNAAVFLEPLPDGAPGTEGETVPEHLQTGPRRVQPGTIILEFAGKPTVFLDCINKALAIAAMPESALVEALKPFAKACLSFEAECMFGALGSRDAGVHFSDETKLAVVHVSPENEAGGQTYNLSGSDDDIGVYTVGDLRRARATLAKATGGAE